MLEGEIIIFISGGTSGLKLVEVQLRDEAEGTRSCGMDGWRFIAENTSHQFHSQLSAIS
jgi:hypothetical protein